MSYLTEPFRCYCRSCEARTTRPDRDAALAFRDDHAAGHVVLSPAANLAGAP